MQLATDRFAHPYYFLRLEDRSTFTGGPADGPQATHARRVDGLFTGTLRVRLVTTTPLLLCDDSKAETQEHDDPVRKVKKGHKTYPVLTAGGRPLLAASSVRGMLWAAYEAVTNSRFGVFPFDAATKAGHGHRLGLRPPAQSGLTTVPVRIERDGDRLRARLLPGTSRLEANGRTAPGDPVCAVCVAVYDRDWTVPDIHRFRHGQPVWAFIGPWRHERFAFWNVEAVRAGDAEPTTPPAGYRPDKRRAGQSDWGEPRWVRGWYCRTERNIDNKHDERFFFANGPESFAEVTGAIADQWRQLVHDYQSPHAEELARGVSDHRP